MATAVIAVIVVAVAIVVIQARADTVVIQEIPQVDTADTVEIQDSVDIKELLLAI